MKQLDRYVEVWMNYFLYKLNTPRPTFPADITPAESKLMQEHSMYWRELMKKGLVVAFGPVADPKRPYGIAIIQLQDNSDAKALGANDPVIKAKAGFNFEVYPMPSVIVPEHHA
ncbi:MAG: YciI family protein [Gammaproteobacteria bacterium]